jgi:glycosyltransferase involved in cell wall biosynthesis
MKISILTPDFSHNCFGRAWLLAKVLQRHYDVEMIGPAFGDGIWGPLKNSCDFKIKMVKGYANGKFEFKEMLGMISGDVIYASKPLIASFGVGLVKKIRTYKPLVLDIDDWELGFGKEFYDSLVWYKKINDFRLSISNCGSYYHALILNKFVRFADVITVSGKVLYSKYGGTIVWHGRDVNIFNPQKFSKIELKRKYLLEKAEDAFIVSFIGTPRPHKGLENLIDAMELIRDEKFLLMIVGTDEDEYCKSLKKRAEDSRLNDGIMFFPEQPFDKLPEFLSIADLVVIPQLERSASYAQVPAKIFDAMAMAKPIIATNVSDIPEILQDCGWIVEPENPRQLAETIKYVFEHRVEAKVKGKKAREKCKREYSWEIMEEKLIAIFEKYKTD